MDKDLISKIENFQELPTDQKWIVIQEALLELSKEEKPKKKGKS